MATVTDSETGIVTTYYYDLLNRQSGYREIGTGLDHSVTYEYDADNNLASMTEILNGATKTYTYTYDDDNRIKTETVDGITVEYSYDGFGRLESRVVKQGDFVVLSSTPTYCAGAEAGTTTGQISSYNGYTYTYDDNGNILSVSDGTNTTSYVYDSQNQLIRENNQAAGKTWAHTYDNAGNLKNRREYTYTTGELTSATSPVFWEYDSSEPWGDLLAYRSGYVFTYDEIGNPISDGTYTYAWEHGRELVSLTKTSGEQVLFTYGADGMRTSQVQKDSTGAVTATYSYIYNGGKLVRMTYNGTVVEFTYDASGTPLTMTVGNSVYYYVTNLQGDIIGIKDSAGQWAAQYSYDAWGNILTQTGTLAALNPLRYRGYVCDDYTGWYYLQSRYYNPNLCRFINADGLVSTGQGLLGNNMFAYCNNNPVIFRDSAGTEPVDTIDLDGDGDIDCYVYEYALEYSLPGIVFSIAVNSVAFYFPQKGKIYIFKDVGPSYLADPKNRPDGFRAGIDYMVAHCGDEDNPNLHVRDSYKCTSTAQRKSIIKVLLEYAGVHITNWNRTEGSLLVEWREHNRYAPFSNSAKHADFDKNDEGKGFLYFLEKVFDRMEGKFD